MGIMQKGKPEETVLSKDEISKFKQFYDKLDNDILVASQKMNGFAEKTKAYSEIDEWMLAQSATKAKVVEQMVELGKDVYVNVECPKNDKLNLEIGLGLWVDFTFEEVKKFIPKVQDLCDLKIKNCKWDINRINEFKGQFDSHVQEINAAL